MMRTFNCRGADYTRIAPPHSFIDALSFNPRQLADRLLELDQNDRQYYRHFWWKDFYQVISTLSMKLLALKMSISRF